MTKGGKKRKESQAKELGNAFGQKKPVRKDLNRCASTVLCLFHGYKLEKPQVSEQMGADVGCLSYAR